MSVVISFDTSASASAARDARKRRVRRTGWTAGTALTLLIAVAAAPLPLRFERDGLVARRDEYTIVVDELTARRTTMHELEAEVASIADLEADRDLWLRDVPNADVAWLLELMATRCGVTINAIASEELRNPLEHEGQSAVLAAGVTQILGVAIDPDAEFDEEESIEWDPEAELTELTPKVFDATRWTLDGQGSLTSVIMFAGLLRASEAPLRLRTFDISRFGETFTFVITADRLRPARAGADEG